MDDATFEPSLTFLVPKTTEAASTGYSDCPDDLINLCLKNSALYMVFILQVFQWFKSAYRVPYPSTLYVTVKGIIPPDTIEPSSRSRNALQEVGLSCSFAFVKQTNTLYRCDG